MFTAKSYTTKPKAGAQINYAHPRARGLMAYWIMNEGSGSRVSDISGRGKHGTATNFAMSGSTSNWSGSRLGGALNFDGTNDYVDVGTSAAIFGTKMDCTICAWVRIITVAASPIVYGEGNLATATPFVMMRVDTSGRFYAQIRGTATTPNNVVTSTRSINDGLWHHCCLTITSNGTVDKIYVDGQSDVFSGTNSTIATITTTNSKIGCLFRSGSASGEAFFPGDIDEVRLYNRMLSAQEAASLYAQPHLDLMQQHFIYAPVSAVINKSRFFLAS